MAELFQKKIEEIEEHPLKFKAPTAISSPLIIITHCNSRQKIATTFSSSTVDTVQDFLFKLGMYKK